MRKTAEKLHFRVYNKEKGLFMSVYRIYVEKKPQFAVEGESLLSDLRTSLRIEGVTGLGVIDYLNGKEKLILVVGDVNRVSHWGLPPSFLRRKVFLA